MKSEFICRDCVCSDCGATFERLFDPGVEKLPLPECCGDCFMKAIGAEPKLASPQAAQ